MDEEWSFTQLACAHLHMYMHMCMEVHRVRTHVQLWVAGL